MAGDTWETRQFGDCAGLVRDTVTPADAARSPYIGLEHIGEGTLSLIGSGTAEDVTSIKSRFQSGDILFGKLRPYFRKVIRAPFDGVCSTDIWVVRPNNRVDAGFLFYWMASTEFVDASMRGSEGTKMPRARWEFVSRIERAVPPIHEQRAIGHILGALDDKIELNRRMNETLEAMERTIFKSWFVDFDPVRAKAEGLQPSGIDAETARLLPAALTDSAFGRVPKAWGVRPLDEIASFLNGLALQKFPPTGGDYLPVIKIAELRRGFTAESDRAGVHLPKDYVVEDGDVLFSWSGSLEACLWAGGRGALNQHLFKVSSIEYPKWFYYHWIRHHLPDFQAIAAGKATTMGHIQRHHLREALTVVPPQQILTTVDKVMCPMLDRGVCAKVESRTLAALRDTLLPKLLSGEIRVGEAEETVGAHL
jgi:type I restriction enzyme S subunit